MNRVENNNDMIKIVRSHYYGNKNCYPHPHPHPHPHQFLLKEASQEQHSARFSIRSAPTSPMHRNSLISHQNVVFSMNSSGNGKNQQNPSFILSSPTRQSEQNPSFLLSANTGFERRDSAPGFVKRDTIDEDSLIK